MSSSEFLTPQGSPTTTPRTSRTQYAALPDEEEADSDQLDNVLDEATPTGTFASSCVNICNTILGSGMLAMPSAIAGVGLGLGIILIGLSGAASAFGLILLTRVAAQVGRSSSFNACAKRTYPNAAVFFDLAIAVKCFGVSVSYLVICGDLLPKVVEGFAPGTPQDSILRTKLFWITLSLLLVSPFCFLSRLDSLRYTSAFALLSVVYLLLIVVYYFLAPTNDMPPHVPWGDVTWFKMDTAFFGYLPIFVFAFTCHQNIFAVYNELDDNHPQRITGVILTSVGTAFSVYETIGVLGYLTFGNEVASNIIGQYPPSPFITGGQLAIALLVLLSYPLQCHPCRASLEKILTHFRKPETDELSWAKWVGMTVVIMVGSFGAAILLKNLATVLAYVGATGSTTICYILPGIFYYKMSEDTPWDATRVGAVTLASMGCVIMATSLGSLMVGGGAGH
ncbi:hypothetical protein SpCBS45565_g03367 [Spizellomyces sp. 'palustris']|nr:hypothetical protein SpCBS45565_g03367 [Spizellomyces sp. 'palustris']